MQLVGCCGCPVLPAALLSLLLRSPAVQIASRPAACGVPLQSIKFFQAMEASNTSCILDLEVVVEERCERYAAMLYPANAARNRALVNARTGAPLGLGCNRRAALRTQQPALGCPAAGALLVLVL